MDRHDFEARADAARASWQYRAITETRSHTTVVGCILLAALGKYPSRAPMLRDGAVIEKDGSITADLWIDAEGCVWGHQPVGLTVDDLKARFNRLADKLKFNDAERGELFTALRQWIRLDKRGEGPPL